MEGAFEIDDAAQRRPIEDHIQSTLLFVQEHEAVLKTIEEATRNAISDATESHYRTVRITQSRTERLLAPDVIATDNEIMKKVLSVLVFLCDEASTLTKDAEVRFYRPLVMFGQSPIPSFEKKDVAVSFRPGEKEIMIGNFLPFLQELSNFVDRCSSVVVNIVQQLSSLINPSETLYRQTFQSSHLLSVFTSLGKLLRVLLTIDTIIQNNETLLEYWSQFKNMIQYTRADPANFSTDDKGVEKFEKLLISIDQNLMIGEIFKTCIEQNFETSVDGDMETHIRVRANQTFLSELLTILKSLLESALSSVNTNAELLERYEIMSSMCLYALYRRLLPANIQPDAKLHKILWGVQRTVPLLILAEKVTWNLGEFLQMYAPLEIKKPDPVNPAAHRRVYLQQFDQSLSERTRLLCSQVSAWLVLCESKLTECMRHEQNVAAIVDVRGSVLLRGVSLASRCSYLALSCLTMHTELQVPLSRSILADVFQLIENLKSIEYTFVRKDLIIAETQTHTIRVLGASILALLRPIKSRLAVSLTTAKRPEGFKQDYLGLLTAAENLVQGSDSYSPSRCAALSLLLEIIIANPLAEKESEKLLNYSRRIVALSRLEYQLKSICDTSFLYFHLDIYPPIIQSIFQHSTTDAHRLHYILSAANDSIRILEMISHSNVNPYIRAYKLYLKDLLKKEILEPLSGLIETDLRLHVYTKHLDHMEALNPKTENLRPLRPFLDLSPIRILGEMISIKGEVTHYLDRNFYNLTTVALHDWRLYAEMRSLAQEKLGIHLFDNYLPMGSLDQGLDVLQIMRNIHIFVSRFTYNMNMQQFVEYRPDKASKHVNTIKIQSIAASIRQHGLGVLNTTVNFTYQFLAQKFHIFSQFLFDDYIRAHLSREHRWFKKHRNDPEVNNMYPYERALKFQREIKKLSSDGGKSYLDQFRHLITEIGNALGYVRMVRSASMYYCSEAVKFLPEFNDIISFEKHAGEGVREKIEEEIIEGEGENTTTKTIVKDGDIIPGSGAGFGVETVRAGRNLDTVIDTLIKNFGSGSDYFKLLVNAFQSVLSGSEHDHLKTFYMILPSLCLSWMDASLQAKENMYKITRGMNNKEMYYTDDGFSMGVAYCLAILKQTRRHDSLHWIETMRGKLKADSKKLEEQQKIRAEKEARIKAKKDKEAGGTLTKAFSFLTGGKKEKVEEKDLEEDYEDMEEIHTLQTTAKRIEAQRRETEQLFFSMNGAGIFFKRVDIDT